jgi:hypothetical protein
MTDTKSAIRVRDQLGKPDEVSGVFVNLFDNIDVQIAPIQVYKRSVIGYTIWGAFNWGEQNWQEPGTADAIWDDAVWDGAEWGDELSNPLLLQSVSNAFNVYIEKFGSTRFYNSDLSSNVTWANGQLVFGGTEGTAVSRRFFMEPVPVTRLLTSLIGEDIENLTMDIQSNNDGVWHSVVINGATDIPASTELIFRIVGDNATVKDLKIKYLRE